MARVASLSYKQRRVLSARVLHIAMIVAAALAAVAIALPSVLSQPTFYTSSATIRFDPAVFPNVIDANGAPTPTLREQQENLGGVLKVIGGQPTRLGFEDLGRRGLLYTYPERGQIVVTAYSLNAATAQQIADEAVGGLTRRLYALNGTPLLRELLGRVDYAALAANSVQNEEITLLRALLLTQAVAEINPQPGNVSLAALSQDQRQALARALEIRYDDILVDIRFAEQTLQNPRASEAERVAATEDRRGALAARNAVDGLIQYLDRTYHTAFSGATDGPAFVAQSAATATIVPTYGRLKLALAGLVGLIGGVLTVLIDRQVGILPKLHELWNYRELIRNMVARDLKARYKNSMLGYLWSLLNPLLMMLVFWLVFSVLLNNSIRMFPVFLIVALLPWNFAVTAVSGGMRSILDNANLVKKVYFPREILPITVVISNLVNYMFALPMMFLVMAGVQLVDIGRINFSWTFAFLPVIIIIQVIFLIGMALLLSTAAVFFRDTTHIVDIVIQLWIFLTPVFFAFEQIVSGMPARMLRWINPMASIIDFYRDILYGQAGMPGRAVIVPTPGLPALDGVFRTLLTALVILALGAYVFHRNSGRFGEEI